VLHLFRALGALMALDVDSGAVHVVDEMAYRALSMAETHCDSEIEAALTREYPAEDVRELMGEIASLRAGGSLLAEHDYTENISPHQGIIKAMCLHAAHDCDLRCRYCFAGTGGFHGPRGLLSLEVGKRALEFLVENSGQRRNLEVDFFGGEPLLNFEVVKALVEYGRELEASRDKRFDFTITTNGLGLTDEIIDFINSEMYNVVISIDGRREVHDFMRPMVGGSGSYDTIIENALKLIKRRGDGQYYVRGTYTARNLDFAQDVLAIHDAGFEHISVEPVVLPEGSTYALTEAMLPRILEEYETLARLVRARRKAGRPITFFHFMVDLSGGPCIRKRLAGCGAGNEYVAVTPEGDIYPCHQFVGREGFRMGSVVDGSIDRAMQAAFSANHVLSKPKCRDCWSKYYCGGGCAANAHAFNGDIAKPYELECHMQRKRMECAMVMVALDQTLT